MNVRKFKTYMFVLLICAMAAQVSAYTVESSVRDGNRLYAQGAYNEAIDKYDQALLEAIGAAEPKFNKANSFYRLDDLVKAKDLYREVSAESKDMQLVGRAKYNLGNCHFQQGMKERDSNLEKAVEELKTSIDYWRQVLDIDAEHQNAARNIEVARLTIKDILDQLKNQQDPNQPQDPNQSQDQQQQQQQQQQDSQQQDPNEANQQQDPNDPNQGSDPNEQQQSEQQEQEEQEEVEPADTTADEILDKEQEQKKERQMMQRRRYRKVEKDW